MNLLEAEWIPVRRLSGAQLMMAPWQVAEASADPIVALSSPRPDFDGALAQFLVGLLQTALPPASESEWRRRFATPPQPEELRQAFARFRHAFDLLGGGPRFFQVRAILEEGEFKTRSIEKLLISHGMSEGNDFFAPMGLIDSMCLPCAAMALMSMQVSAPKGGSGYFVGLRGGGPMTTMVWTESSLWQALWLNILPESEFRADPVVRGQANDRLIFPWLESAESTNPSRVTTFADVEPLQMYWPMPRRMWLQEPDTAGRCGICGAVSVAVIHSYLTKTHGIKYSGVWSHPLTPYHGMPEAKASVKGKREGIVYREWLGLVQHDGDYGEPARVVDAFFRQSRGERTSVPCRLWAFGYAMSDMKPLGWCEGLMPLFLAPTSRRAFVEEEVVRLIVGARAVQAELGKSVGAAMTGQDRKGRTKTVEPPVEIERRFWQETEGGFYARVRALCDDVADDDAARTVREAWHAELCRVAERIFDDFAERFWFGSVDPGRVARAGIELRTKIHGKKTLDAFRLPTPAAPTQGESKPVGRSANRAKEKKTDG